MRRRDFLLALSTLPLLATCTIENEIATNATLAVSQLTELEQTSALRLGLFALNTTDGRTLLHRADEAFPLCSTFKVILTAAVLDESAQTPDLLERWIAYNEDDLVAHSPMTANFVENGGATVVDLCAAALQYSDNTAANLLMKLVGGPQRVTSFARSLGDQSFHLDRWEPALNDARPDDRRDTTTPRAMGQSLQRLLIGDRLQKGQQALLRSWMGGNRTGDARIRAAVPPDWAVADKTGSGDFGTANDIAVLWPNDRGPIVLTIYTTHQEKTAKLRDDVLASATRIVLEWAA